MSQLSSIQSDVAMLHPTDLTLDTVVDVLELFNSTLETHNITDKPQCIQYLTQHHTFIHTVNTYIVYCADSVVSKQISVDTMLQYYTAVYQFIQHCRSVDMTVEFSMPSQSNLLYANIKIYMIAAHNGKPLQQSNDKLRTACVSKLSRGTESSSTALRPSAQQSTAAVPPGFANTYAQQPPVTQPTALPTQPSSILQPGALQPSSTLTAVQLPNILQSASTSHTPFTLPYNTSSELDDLSDTLQSTQLSGGRSRLATWLADSSRNSSTPVRQQSSTNSEQLRASPLQPWENKLTLNTATTNSTPLTTTALNTAQQRHIPSPAPVSTNTSVSTADSMSSSPIQRTESTSSFDSHLEPAADKQATPSNKRTDTCSVCDKRTHKTADCPNKPAADPRVGTFYRVTYQGLNNRAVMGPEWSRNTRSKVLELAGKYAAVLSYECEYDYNTSELSRMTLKFGSKKDVLAVLYKCRTEFPNKCHETLIKETFCGSVKDCDNQYCIWDHSA